jgi:hypothetical protein
MACTACFFVWLLLLVAMAKIHSEKQVPVAGTNKANRPTGQSGLPNLFQACLLCFVPPTIALVLLKWMFHKLICVEQSTFLRYL